jgi:hypothetical protein
VWFVRPINVVPWAQTGASSGTVVLPPPPPSVLSRSSSLLVGPGPAVSVDPLPPVAAEPPMPAAPVDSVSGRSLAYLLVVFVFCFFASERFRTLCVCHHLLSQVVGPSPKVALVIGNDAYGDGFELHSAVSSASEIASRLVDLGFETIRCMDVDREAGNAALDAFLGRLSPGCAALFYFCGHGWQAGPGHDCLLVPTDFAGANPAGAFHPPTLLYA